MHRLLPLCLAFCLCSLANFTAIPRTAIEQDVYDFTLKLNVPQVLKNTESKGYRKYQKQTIKGKMNIVWNSDGTYRLSFSNLKNKNFKVRDAYVTYKGTEDASVIFHRFNYIGSNKTNKFKTPSLSFYIELEPSYALGGATEDNSFCLVLSGSGTSTLNAAQLFNGMPHVRYADSFKGYAAGTQGCGCADYGHKSPTRIATKNGPSDIPEDVVATYGTWKAKWRTRAYCW